MRKAAIVFGLLIFCGAAGTVAKGRREKLSSASEAGVQDTVYLDRRISTLETRLYSIESSLRALEQQATMSRSAPVQSARDPETTLLRSEVEILKSRLREVECGLAHLDERTLSAAAKESRKRAGAQPQEPCRVDPEATIQIAPRR